MLIAHRNGMATSVTLYRWIRMHISKVRANAGQVQLSEIKMLDNGGGVYAWPEGTTCYNTTSHSNSGTFGTEQTPDKLIDGNTSTKMCAIDLGSTNYFGFDIYIDFGECVFDAQKWCKWCWYTADDNPGRDPVTFSLYLSTDAETWIPVDSCADVSITETRFALAYTGDINLNMEYVKTGLVAMWDGIWNAGVGVHDPNATVLKNLYGTSDATLSSMTVASDHMRTSYAGNIVFPMPTVSTDFTIEIVSKLNGFTETDVRTFFNGNDKCFSTVTGASTLQFIARAGSDAGIVFQNDARYVARYISWTVDSSSVSLYSNGALYMSAGSPPALPSVYYFPPSSVSQYVDNSMYSLRIYNRTLTAAEIANNYSIDQARFNLP